VCAVRECEFSARAAALEEQVKLLTQRIEQLERGAQNPVHLSNVEKRA
jgi:hypothetical protein